MSLKQTVDAILSRATDAGDVPGVVAIATDRNGTLYEGAFGKRVVGQPAPMTLDTVAWIASMTKAITSSAAMQLVERGQLALHEPVKRWVPQIGAAQVLEGFDAQGRPRTRAPKREITLSHLLTHTAGFGYEFWSESIQKFQQATETPGIIACQDNCLRTPLLFDPGERWNYGINIDWVGKAVEATSGMRLGAYLQQNILGPLGMGDTAFRISPSMRSRLAKIHQRGDDGALAATDVEIPQDPEFEMGGGGLYGTAVDYAKFVRMILHRGQGPNTRILKADTVDLMGRNQTGDIRVTALKTAMPPLSNDAEFFPGVEKRFGYGFQINTERAPTGLSPNSLMWAGLANSYYWIDPTRGIGGVYVSQILPFADVKSAPLFMDFQKAVYQSLG
ncbi:MAG TPA: serine hydrolase domain-containing protein [Burkholderiaceae bacterium]|nr:serine hydrolase domain-containing protein [Burkholderiaceae bacterium]